MILHRSLPLASTLLLVFAWSVPCIGQKWKIHDMNRPQPTVIDPGTAGTQDQPGRPPSDAVILFNGKDLSEWQSRDGSPPRWKVENGYMETFKGAGMLWTRKPFGDCQLHIEWAAPSPPSGSSQGRGNSGVYIMGRYEIQILDSYQNITYPDGQAAAVYGEFPPLVNASRPPGQWQAFDVIFHGPRFDGSGKLLRPARVTALHNGIVVQDNVELTGPTENKIRLPYTPHPEKLPLGLQDHGNPVRFRNIWIRELPSEPPEPSQP